VLNLLQIVQFNKMILVDTSKSLVLHLVHHVKVLFTHVLHVLKLIS